MGSMKCWIVALIVVGGILFAAGCRTTPAPQAPKLGEAEDTSTKIVEMEPQKPLWVDSVGPWEEEWNAGHANEVGQYIWVVGTSQKVESIAFEQAAIKGASDHAIRELTNALGITVESLEIGTEAWSNETRDLVIGTYKEALATQIAEHKLNFQPYSWFSYVVEEPAGVGGYKPTSYIKKGLFRLDKNSLNAAVVEATTEEFAKGLEKRVKVNRETQRKLVDIAKKRLLEHLK